MKVRKGQRNKEKRREEGREGRRERGGNQRGGREGKNWFNRNISLSIRRKTRWIPCLTGASFNGSKILYYFNLALACVCARERICVFLSRLQ